ncbi:MAG: hypothetical protein HOV80_29805 [Polyangiaceae bacterium]|nr:hypothetical protein [Polyangiaceae bacterium]
MAFSHASVESIDMSRGARNSRQTYNAANIRRYLTPNMRQAPPLHVQRQTLNISPITRRILDRIEHRRETIQERREDQLERLTDLYREGVREPLGDKPGRAPIVHPCTEFSRTADQFEELQRFRMFAELERDPLERMLAAVAVRKLLEENERELYDIATVCRPGLPQPSQVVAAIISIELANRVFGHAPAYAVMRAAPSGPQMSREAGMAIDRERREASFAAVPIPEATVVTHANVQRVLAYLREHPPARNPR